MENSREEAVYQFLRERLRREGYIARPFGEEELENLRASFRAADAAAGSAATTNIAIRGQAGGSPRASRRRAPAPRARAARHPPPGADIQGRYAV